MSSSAPDAPGTRRWLTGGILALAVVAAIPLLRHQLEAGLQAGIDWHLHACWVEGFTQALSEGVWIPRWLPAVNAGYGAPVFVFYPPAVYYLLAAGTALGDPTQGMKTLALILSALVGIGTFSWLRPAVGAKYASAFALCAIALPQLLWPLLRYNMPAQALGYALAPFVFAGFERCLGKRRGGAAWLAVAFGLLIASHFPTAMIVSMALGIATAWRLATDRDWPNIARTLSALGLGLLLSANWWLPAIAEADLVHLHYLREAQVRISDNLMFSAGPVVSFPGETAAWEVSAGILVALVTLLAVLKSRSLRGNTESARILRAWLLVALVTFAMGTGAARLLYENVSTLAFVQFGWRWHGVFALLCLRVTAGLLAARHDQESPRVQSAALVATTAAMLGSWAIALTLTTGSSTLSLARQDRTRPDDIQWAARTCPWDTLEHRPVSMGRAWTRDLRGDRASAMTSIRGRVHVVAAEIGVHRRVYSLRADFDSLVRLRLLDFPGWRARIDTNELAIEHDDMGAVLLRVPKGEHRLELTFENTPARTVASGLSTLAVLVLLLVAFSNRLRPPTPGFRAR